MPQFYRVGDKLIDRDRLLEAIDQILTLRQQGLSQQDVARRVGVDRTFVSRLEGLGELRKGQSIAVVGFPVANKAELEQACREAGVDFTFLLTERERWAFLEQKTGLELFNELMTLLAEIRRHPVVIILGNNQPARFIAALLDREAAVLRVPQTPGTNGHFDPAAIRRLVTELRGIWPAREGHET